MSYYAYNNMCFALFVPSVGGTIHRPSSYHSLFEAVPSNDLHTCSTCLAATRRDRHLDCLPTLT